MSPIYPGSCPHCRGAVEVDKDSWGPRALCLTCSRDLAVEVRLSKKGVRLNPGPILKVRD